LWGRLRKNSFLISVFEKAAAFKPRRKSHRIIPALQFAEKLAFRVALLQLAEKCGFVNRFERARLQAAPLSSTRSVRL
jgi:hypothetical protein